MIMYIYICFIIYVIHVYVCIIVGVWRVYVLKKSVFVHMSKNYEGNLLWWIPVVGKIQEGSGN